MYMKLVGNVVYFILIMLAGTSRIKYYGDINTWLSVIAPYKKALVKLIKLL